jgi:catechol O-methyltransferase
MSSSSSSIPQQLAANNTSQQQQQHGKMSISKGTGPEGLGMFDGRELACLEHVRRTAERNPAAVTAAIDDFAYHNKWMMNVGDVKGKILDEAVARAQPRNLLELGTYVGYSSLRMIQIVPKEAHIYSVEFSESMTHIARQMIDHAGMSDRITVVNGYLNDDKQRTKRFLEEHLGFTNKFLDFVFIDHAKEAYLPDLKMILQSGWLHRGSVVFADNVLYPGAPDYKRFMEEQEGVLFKTKMYNTYVEYQDKIPDLVLESVYIEHSGVMICML